MFRNLKVKGNEISKQYVTRKIRWHEYKKQTIHDGQKESAIYMLQRISLDKKVYNLFFDSGCGDLVCKKEAINRYIRP